MHANINNNTIDVTLPTSQECGRLHPLCMTIRLLEKIMRSHNLIKEDSPRLEDEKYNFTFLNIPPEHPARSLHDSFYTKKGKLLRTHGTGMTARVLEIGKHLAPFGAFAIGSTYRRDDDSTHSPMFHQMDCFVVGPDITIAHLKGHVKYLLEAFFAPESIETRFRVTHFPFTEPSLEVDIRRKNGDWMEVLGAGMLRNNILKRFGYENMRGFAIGLGVERVAMLKYGINNITDLYENRLDFLNTYGKGYV